MAKVLLVEDDNNLREIFEMRLQAEGYQTVTASNGEEGLVVAMKEKPDLLIADVMMPKLSGFEMLETLRASPETKDIKAVMMTALGQAEDQARGERAGVIKYLVKSQVTLEDFIRVIREVLEPGQAAPAATAAATGPVPSNSLTANNKQESENTNMPDDTTPTNPMPTPPADGAMPAAEPAAAPTNPITGEGSMPSMPDSGQMTTAQQQDTVTGQVNDFAASAPAEPAAAPTMPDPAPADGGSVPVSPAPAPEAPAEPAAPAEGATPPADTGMPTPGTI